MLSQSRAKARPVGPQIPPLEGASSVVAREVSSMKMCREAPRNVWEDSFVLELAFMGSSEVARRPGCFEEAGMGHREDGLSGSGI